MSERQAKKLRKQEPEVVKAPVKKAKSPWWFTLIIVVVIAAVVAVGGWAVWQQYTETHPSTDPETVADRAETEGISVEELLTKYGIDGVEEVDKDTAFATAQGYMSITKYAESMGVSADQVKLDNRMPETVTDDMTINEAIGYVKMSDMAELQGTDIATLRETYGLTEEELPGDMLYKDAEEIINAAYQKMIEEMMGGTESGIEVVTDEEAAE